MQSVDNNWKKTFFVIWTGQAFSLLGSSAAQFAIIWWLTIQTGSAAVLATASMVGFLPQALIGPFAGVWVDRMSRRTVMITADLFIAATSLFLVIAFLSGTPDTWFIYLILFLRAVGAVFHTPAMQAAMPMLVPVSELTRTGGWSQFLASGSFMLGPVLGTFLMTAFSMPAVMLIDIIGAVIAAAVLLAVHIPDPPTDPTTRQHIVGDMLDGMREIGRNKALKAITIPMIFASLIYVPVGSLFPLMVNIHFGGTAWHASLVEFLFAGGMLVSSLILGVWGGLKNKFAMIILAVGVLGIAMTATGALPPSAIFAFAGISALMGMTGVFLTIPYMAYIQETVPPAALGRVFSIVTSLMALAIPLGLFVAGPIAEIVGIAAWFLVSGVLMMLTALLGHVLTRRF